MLNYSVIMAADTKDYEKSPKQKRLFSSNWKNKQK